MRSLLLSSLAIALSAGPSTAIAAPAVQTINLYSYGFSPKPITLAAGREVTLNFVNTSTKSHDFTAPEFFAASRIVAGAVGGGEVDLKGGEARSVTLVPAAGKYKVHCGHPFHAIFGMKSTIVVR